MPQLLALPLPLQPLDDLAVAAEVVDQVARIESRRDLDEGCRSDEIKKPPIDARPIGR
jgi:hypothetical protein